jgi:hypothetical protein
MASNKSIASPALLLLLDACTDDAAACPGTIPKLMPFRLS